MNKALVNQPNYIIIRTIHVNQWGNKNRKPKTTD